MKAPWTNLNGYPRAIVLSACVLLVSLGMCGAQIVVVRVPLLREVIQGPFILLTIAETLAVLAATFVLLFSLIAWPISSLINLGKRKNHP